MISQKTILTIALALTLPALTACGSTGSGNFMTAMPDHFVDPVDPDDAELVASIQQYLKDNKGPLNSQYEYVRMDLNNDGLREGIVLFNLPHSYWCGWSGCTMAIFEAGDNRFALKSETQRIRGPLVLAQNQTNGWEDIVVRLSGMNEADRNVVLKFNGLSYPDNPLMGDDIPYDVASLSGTRIFP